MLSLRLMQTVLQGKTRDVVQPSGTGSADSRVALRPAAAKRSKRILILLAKSPNLTAAEEADRGEIPRIEYVELARAIGATILDFHDVAQSQHPFVKLARSRGARYGLAALGMTRRHDFDEFYVTGEDIGLPFGMLMRAAGDLGRITMVVHHCGTPKRRLLFRSLGHTPYRNVIVLATRQREIFVSDLGFPPHKVHGFEQWLDTRFYRPLDVPLDDYVFSCGRESRDYALLQRAARMVPHQFRVVASGWAPHSGFDSATDIGTSGNLEVVAKLTYNELRDVYARSRFVVVPLDEVDYAAGVTGICEAMAMGKAVITTDSPGIRDYVSPGVSGLIVPIGDARALAGAIEELMSDPERCARMGEHNRDWVVREMSVDRYVDRVSGLFGLG